MKTPSKDPVLNIRPHGKDRVLNKGDGRSGDRLPDQDIPQEIPIPSTSFTRTTDLQRDISVRAAEGDSGLTPHAPVSPEAVQQMSTTDNGQRSTETTKKRSLRIARSTLREEKQSIQHALKVRNRIEKLSGAGTILMSREELRALTEKQWEEFFIVASAAAEGRKDVRIILYGETRPESSELSSSGLTGGSRLDSRLKHSGMTPNGREAELRRIDGLKLSVTEFGMEAAFQKFGLPNKAAVNLYGRAGLRERHSLVKSLRLDEEQGLITLALLYVLADGKEKGVRESSEGELFVRAELRMVLQDYLNQCIVAWAA